MSGETTTVIELHLSSDVLAALRARGQSLLSDEQQVKVSLAVGLFAEGVISLAKAARLAGMTRYEFAAFLKSRGLPSYGYTSMDYQQDKTFVESAKE